MFDKWRSAQRVKERSALRRTLRELDQREKFRLKQELAMPSRYYGDGGTIHGTNHVDIEVHDGEVVSVWFRCSIVPFQVHEVDEARANSMRRVFQGHIPMLTGIEILDQR